MYIKLCTRPTSAVSNVARYSFRWQRFLMTEKKSKKKFDKYLYYENSVQTPEEHVSIFDRMFLELRGRQALTLREDFCGTFLISCEWVKRNPKNVALGIDLDPEPLGFGKKNHYSKLTLCRVHLDSARRGCHGWR